MGIVKKTSPNTSPNNIPIYRYLKTSQNNIQKTLALASLQSSSTVMEVEAWKATNYPIQSYPLYRCLYNPLRFTPQKVYIVQP